MRKRHNDTFDCAAIRERLHIHRCNLAHYLKQQAYHTGAFVPPAIINGIAESRNEIEQLKEMLLHQGEVVEDLPDDWGDQKRVPTVSISLTRKALERINGPIALNVVPDREGIEKHIPTLILSKALLNQLKESVVSTDALLVYEMELDGKGLQPYPPKLEAYLLHYLPRKYRDDVIGDLEEEFYDISQRFGRDKAMTWYRWQVIMSFWPFAERLLKRLIKWCVLGWIGQ